MMDDLMQILLFGMFGLLMILGRKKKVDLTDLMPETKDNGQETAPMEAVPEISDSESVCSCSDTEAQESNISSPAIHKRMDSPSVSQPQQRMGKREPSVSMHPKISLKTHSEARKAFLYSEIFNRKYEH